MSNCIGMYDSIRHPISHHDKQLQRNCWQHFGSQMMVPYLGTLSVATLSSLSLVSSNYSMHLCGRCAFLLIKQLFCPPPDTFFCRDWNLFWSSWLSVGADFFLLLLKAAHDLSYFLIPGSDQPKHPPTFSWEPLFLEKVVLSGHWEKFQRCCAC